MYTYYVVHICNTKLNETINCLKVSGIAHEWFSSYLGNRNQVVCENNVISNVSSASFGVPQGSVLGPLPFLIYSISMI